MEVESLAAYRHCIDRIDCAWPAFSAKRSERLAQQQRFGEAAEKVAENIVEDLFTTVLDWSLTDFNNQVGYADIVLTRLGIKHLVIEVKRPGALAWNRRAIESALSQACRYAAQQKVARVAICDGFMLYAADVEHGGLSDRVFVSLQDERPQQMLWWLSVQGIYRPRREVTDAAIGLLPEEPMIESGELGLTDAALLHPKYKVPAACFAYVGDASDPKTWKLPFLCADGTIDAKRMPKAIQAILSNYRGEQIHSIPEAAVPDVLVRLARAAIHAGRMTPTGDGHDVYAQLGQALDQVGRLSDIAS